MATNSPIEWTEATWNPVVGCTVLSPGCTNCYAMRLAARLAAMGSLYVTRPISLDYVRTRKELTSITDAIFTMYKTRQLKLLVNPAYALKDVGTAHRDLESRGTTGKLVLSISK